MTDAQQREAARQFYYRWKDKGREDEDARSYWIEILLNILGVEKVTERVDFEKKVAGPDGNTKRIDVYIPETRVLIEQKSLGIALDKPQAGHGGMTPYEQAKMYDNGLPFDEKSRWIVTSNFAEIRIYDMNQRKPEESAVRLALADLPAKYHLLDFLVNQETKEITEEMEISIKAGEVVGLMYDAFLKQYKHPDDPETLKSLNKLCVRIVFCLYAEDAGIFGKHLMFHDYLERFSTRDLRKGLVNLFRVLSQNADERDPYLKDDDPLLAAFPYVNGGLFSDELAEIPPFTEELRDLILNKASADFDWSKISPTIFGAVFESTLNPETRRKGGMHYTSIENIHKVIDPLFLDDLKAELQEIKAEPVQRTRTQKLKAYHDKLSSLTFLDPAAGSGNFLTETYICLRRLENEVISLLTGGQITFGDAINPIQVQISQLYGIEINDFAVTVAKTALWIAESQMMKETEDVVHLSLNFLPLKTNAHIREGNALRIDWNDVVPKDKLNYIMGNPPFVGYKFQSRQQKEDIESIAYDIENYGTLDYVSGWYIKASKYITNTEVTCAFVSTNSVAQGEHVTTLWKPLFQNGIHIDFAYRTFRWDSEATMKAHVHCVIIGFKKGKEADKKIVWNESGQEQIVKHINGYLLNAPDIFIEKRKTPWTKDIPECTKGNAAMDNGGLILTEEEKDNLLKQEPELAPIIRQHMSADDFLNGKKQYCLWLQNVSPTVYRNSKEVQKRLKFIQDYRNSSNRAATKKMANFPMLFAEIRQPKTNYIMIPVISSERRRYVPMAFLPPEIINSYASISIPDAEIYHFGILSSNVHNAWIRAVCGRLEMRFRYSSTIVYNNFPWPDPTPEQKAKIEQTAQDILDARALYPEASLADLYDPLTMPPELSKAHKDNDAAVMRAYGMPIKETDEAACVAWLMRLYQQKVNEQA